MNEGDTRVALVSSGSRGIGAAIVRRLAGDGWDVGFGYYRDDEAAARAVARDAAERGARVLARPLDVSDRAAVTAWYAHAEAVLGPAGALVSCAGLLRDRPLARLDAADWRAMIDTSRDGLYHLCRAAVTAMVPRGRGAIVVVSSVCGEYDHVPLGYALMGRPGLPGFVRTLAGQVGRFGVTVNAVTPGHGGRDTAGLVPERTRGDLAETIAVRRFAGADAAAGQVAFLLSPLAAGRSGTVTEVGSPALSGVR